MRSGRTAPEDCVIPEGWTYDNVGQCRSCGAPMVWCITPAGKRSPLNRDGVSHFATCPSASAHRRPR